MGRGDRGRILDPTAPRFVTCTVLEWLPLCAQPANVEILLDSLRHLQCESGLILHGDVIVENHCRLLAHSPSLPKTLASFKSCTRTSAALRMIRCTGGIPVRGMMPGRSGC